MKSFFWIGNLLYGAWSQSVVDPIKSQVAKNTVQDVNSMSISGYLMA